MDTTVCPRGLICSLALVPDPKNPDVFLGLEVLINRLRPAVAGLLLDPMFWSAAPNRSGPVSSSLLEEVITTMEPGLSLWVRITGTSADQTLHICRQLETTCRRLNFRGPLAWVDTPLFYHSNRGLPDHYRNLLAETEFSLIVDNDPRLIREIGDKAKRKNIRTSVVKKLAQEPRLVGLIHRGDLQRAIHYQRAVREHANFLVYDGGESSFLKQPSASGVVSVGANLLPYEWRSITLASLNLNDSHLEQGSRFSHLWESGQRLRTLLKYYDPAPARIIPAVLDAWGLIRQNGQPLSPEEQEAMDRILEHMPQP